MFKKLYELENGFHFNEVLLNYALGNLIFEGGSQVSLEDSKNLAIEHEIKFSSFNKYDWCYTLNLIISDYYTLGWKMCDYVNLAKKFLYDADFGEGKAYKFFVMSQE